MHLLAHAGVFSEVWSIVSPLRVATGCIRLGGLSPHPILTSSSAPPGLGCSPSRAFRASAAEDGRQVEEPVKFMSRERTIFPSAPFERPPICFPDFHLQLVKLTSEQIEEIRKTGWLREAIFKTKPSTTKLEIRAILERVYGMHVESVHTINYLGVKRSVMTTRGRRLMWREDDWKKTYVMFKPMPGMVLPDLMQPKDTRTVLEKLRSIMGAGKRAESVLPNDTESDKK